MKIASRKRVKNRHKNNSGKSKRTRKDNTMGDTGFVDQISQLPDHLIHHIISFLRTKDACRTSILSKKWRAMWDSFPILDFDQRNFKEQEKERRGLSEGQNLDRVGESFKDSVSLSLWMRHFQKLSIQKFRLFVTSHVGYLDLHLQAWMLCATSCDVKELDLQVKENRNCCCPEDIYTANTITALRLHGCKLNADCVIKLPLLQKLNLGGIRVDQQIFENFISSCPLIVDLRLVRCSGLQTVRLVDLVKLNRVELHQCFDIKWVDIVAPNLQTFWYYGKKSVQCDLNLSSCRTLKSLTLDDARMTGEWLENQLSNFPSLEKLVLSRCRMLKSITIISERLKRLSLRICKNLAEAMIDAPKLISFEYEGDKLPFSSMDPSSLQEATLSLDPPLKCPLNVNDRSWNDKLREFLGKFNRSSGLKLVVRSNKNVIVYDELRGIKLPQISDLKVEIIKSSTSFEDLLDNVIQSSHPERLSLVTSSSDDILKFIREMFSLKLGKPSCCGFYVNKCWRHYLEEVDVVRLGDSDHTGNKRTSEWITWLKSSKTRSDAFNFRFKWKRNLQA